jgi:hypothetical protein
MTVCDIARTRPCGNCLLCKRRRGDARLRRLQSERRAKNLDSMAEMLSLLVAAEPHEGEVISFIKDDIPYTVTTKRRKAT